mmetsp:Transcript_30594/g.79663  ORF Transcript_30594/g.79663 Transcript_30594/m.79663 type:complete len:250 (-) Transcript_30594:29-778(-)
MLCSQPPTNASAACVASIAPASPTESSATLFSTTVSTTTTAATVASATLPTTFRTTLCAAPKTALTAAAAAAVAAAAALTATALCYLWLPGRRRWCHRRRAVHLHQNRARLKKVPGRLRGAGVPQRHDRMLRATGLDSAGRRCGWRFECTVGARFRGQCTVGARFRGQRLEHTMQQLLEGQQMQPQGCEEQMPQKEGVHEMPGVLWPLRQRLIVLVAYYVMHAWDRSRGTHLHIVLRLGGSMRHIYSPF